MTEEKIYDVVIIGAGPAGMTAAVYTSRANLSTLMIPHDELVSFAGALHNLLPVTIGNAIGGGFFVGALLWFSQSSSKH